MLKPVVSTLTAHAMMAPAAIRIRLTPRPIVNLLGVRIQKARGSPAARDSDELEVGVDLPEQPLQSGHERRGPPHPDRRGRAEPEGTDDQGFADLFEFVHDLRIPRGLGAAIPNVPSLTDPLRHLLFCRTARPGT